MSAARIVIGRLQALKASLLSPIGFYQMHLEPYRELAKNVTIQTLSNLRPADADPAVWEQQARQLAGMVQASLSTSIIGMTIALSDPRISLPADAPTNFSSSGLSITEIQRFVMAGREKEDADAPGKNLDSRDDGKSDLQIAWRIMYAIRLHKAGADRLSDAIRRYLGSEQRTEAEKLLPQVLAAWVRFFEPRANSDWAAWVHKTVLANA